LLKRERYLGTTEWKLIIIIIVIVIIICNNKIIFMEEAPITLRGFQGGPQ